MTGVQTCALPIYRWQYRLHGADRFWHQRAGSAYGGVAGLGDGRAGAASPERRYPDSGSDTIDTRRLLPYLVEIASLVIPHLYRRQEDIAEKGRLGNL